MRRSLAALVLAVSLAACAPVPVSDSYGTVSVQASSWGHSGYGAWYGGGYSDPYYYPWYSLDAFYFGYGNPGCWGYGPYSCRRAWQSWPYAYYDPWYYEPWYAPRYYYWGWYSPWRRHHGGWGGGHGGHCPSWHDHGGSHAYRPPGHDPWEGRDDDRDGDHGGGRPPADPPREPWAGDGEHPAAVDESLRRREMVRPERGQVRMPRAAPPAWTVQLAPQTRPQTATVPTAPAERVGRVVSGRGERKAGPSRTAPVTAGSSLPSREVRGTRDAVAPLAIRPPPAASRAVDPERARSWGYRQRAEPALRSNPPPAPRAAVPAEPARVQPLASRQPREPVAPAMPVSEPRPIYRQEPPPEISRERPERESGYRREGRDSFGDGERPHRDRDQD